MDSVIEVSDPGAPRRFQGSLVAHSDGPLQSWKILDTDEHGQMLFIDNYHQSSLKDEHIYHESFVHNLMAGLLNPKRVLILGGAEGCLAREVLKWSSVEEVTQVDWDSSLIEHFRGADGLIWNGGVYNDPRVKVVIAEALSWLQSCQDTFDAIFVDLLDPSDTSIGFLKAVLFEAKRCLSPVGSGLSVNVGVAKPSVVTHACGVADFMKVVFEEPQFHRVASRNYVPSFYGDWCFLMAVPKYWSQLIHTVYVPQGMRHFTVTELLRSTLWPTFYPEALTLFWQPSAKEVAEKKLAVSSAYSESKDISEYYGC